MAPTDAKASCLYPNSARALNEASKRGFDNAVVLDALGNVAELATANLWIAKDGVAVTPAPNGTFLNGITKQRARTSRKTSSATPRSGSRRTAPPSTAGSRRPKPRPRDLTPPAAEIGRAHV